MNYRTAIRDELLRIASELMVEHEVRLAAATKTKRKKTTRTKGKRKKTTRTKSKRKPVETPKRPTRKWWFEKATKAQKKKVLAERLGFGSFREFVKDVKATSEDTYKKWQTLLPKAKFKRYKTWKNYLKGDNAMIHTSLWVDQFGNAVELFKTYGMPTDKENKFVAKVTVN